MYTQFLQPATNIAKNGTFHVALIFVYGLYKTNKTFMIIQLYLNGFQTHTFYKLYLIN